MTLHTPGPWRVDLDDAPMEMACIKAGDDRSIGAVDIAGRELEDMANASLIAAAPDLLEALRAMLRQAEEGYGPCMVEEPLICPKCAARAAIAKATP